MSTGLLNRPAGTPDSPVEPRTRRRLRRRTVVIIVAALVLLLSVTGWLVFFSSVLATEQVTVRGARQLSRDQVSEAAAVPLGLPLARQDLDGIARRMTTLPPVQSATVTREWPNRIVLTVVERTPLLAVRRPDGFLVVDRFGIAYESRATRPPGAVIADVNPDATPVLTEVGVVAAALPKKLESKVSSIKATTTDDISLVLESGVVVTWGTSAESALKAETVLALLEEKPRVSINVSSPHNPAIR